MAKTPPGDPDNSTAPRPSLDDPRHLVAAPANILNPADRRRQRHARLEMVRRWWAFEMPPDQVVRMGMTHFRVAASTVTALLRTVQGDMEEEANAADSTPFHIVRQQHRSRFLLVFSVAMQTGKLSTAERAARSLAQMDGVMVADEDAPKGNIPVAQQGARGLTDEDLLEILTSGSPRVVEVPFTVRGPDEAVDDEGEGEGADE